MSGGRAEDPKIGESVELEADGGFRCADGLLVETTAWEGVFDRREEGGSGGGLE